jgi:hypothetical protein
VCLLGASRAVHLGTCWGLGAEILCVCYGVSPGGGLSPSLLVLAMLGVQQLMCSASLWCQCWATQGVCQFCGAAATAAAAAAACVSALLQLDPCSSAVLPVSHVAPGLICSTGCVEGVVQRRVHPYMPTPLWCVFLVSLTYLLTTHTCVIEAGAKALQQPDMDTTWDLHGVR